MCSRCCTMTGKSDRLIGPVNRLRSCMIQILMQSSARLFFLLVATLAGTFAAGADSPPLPPSITTAPLSVDQVVDNLVRRDLERAQALGHYESTRVYRLTYNGFPGDRQAEMTVEAAYDSPSTKRFQIISQSGSNLIINRVFKRLLESEKEATEPEMHAHTLLNRDNTDFFALRFQVRIDGGIWANVCQIDRARENRLHRARPGVVNEPLHFHIRPKSLLKPSLPRAAQPVGDHGLRVCHVREMADTQDDLLRATGGAHTQRKQKEQRSQQFHFFISRNGNGTLSRRILRRVTSTVSANVYRSRMLAMALRTSTINRRSPQWASSGQEHGW